MKKRIVGYAVEIDGKPAALGLHHVDMRGLLVPASTEPLIINRGEQRPVVARRRAERLVDRTQKTAAIVRGSVVFDWPLLRDLTKPHKYTVKPVWSA